MKVANRRTIIVGSWGILGVLGMSSGALANLSRNTSSAGSMGDRGELVIDTAVEWEKDPDAKLLSIPVAMQYGFFDKLEVVLESSLHEREKLDKGETVSGFGDTEITMSTLLREADGAWPAIVIGVKGKIPTASEDLGSGEFDYSGLAVLGHEWGEWEVNLELEYAAFGSPPDEEELEQQLLYTLSAEYGILNNMAVFAEAFGNSAPIDGESRTDAALVGLEVDVALGETAAPYFSLEVDTEEVITARFGVEWTFVP